MSSLESEAIAPTPTHSPPQSNSHRPEPCFAAALDALPAQIAVLDASGVIVAVNAAWRAFGAANGLQLADAGVGSNYLAICEQGSLSFSDPPVADGLDDGRRAARGIRSVLSGTLPLFSLEYACDSPTQERWCEMTATPLPGPSGATGAVLMHRDITHRKQISRRLALLSLETERRERMFSTLLSSIADPTFVVDRDARVLYASAPMLEAWGRTLEESLGKKAVELGYPPDLALRLDAQVDYVFRTGGQVKDEMPYRGANGTAGYYEYIMSPAHGPDRTVEFVVGCSREVTARRRSEEALKESIAEFRTLASAMPQIVWACTAEGQLVYLNGQWVEYTGRSVADGLGAGWLASVHPDDAAEIAESLQHAFRNGQAHSSEVRLRGTAGAYRWWLTRCAPVIDETGRTMKWIGTFTDVDDLKQAESKVSRANDELRRQRGELRVLFDLVPALVWVEDVAGKVVEINERAARYLGRTVQEALGRDIGELFPQLAGAHTKEHLEIVCTGRPQLGRLRRTVATDGSETWFQSDKVPYRDGDGRIVGILAMHHDVSERKRVQDALHELNASLEDRVRERTAELALARDEAERANEAKSVFLATMSHEIRTPMSGLLGLLELLELSRLDAEQRSTLAVARESGRSLQQIIDSILDFSRIEADSLELHVAPASLKQVVEGACRLHEAVARGKGLSLEFSVDPSIRPTLLFDPLRLGQIIGNLVGNAIKFTERGSVQVRAERLRGNLAQDHVRLTVTDTGIGIPEDRIGHLFQPFVQAEASTATRFGGTGLGLFIARRLADLMQGTLSLESAPGKGTRISLTLALEVVNGRSAPELPSLPPRGRLDALIAQRPAAASIPDAAARGTLLLIVDDHPINRMVLLRQVSTLGYAAEAAADGVCAFQAWESGRFGAVITDCSMPRMSGYELAGAIRAREAASGTARIPIIGCTANALVSAAQACMEAGMDDWVSKPVTLEELCAKLDQWIPLVRVDEAHAAAPRPVARRRPVGRVAEGVLDHALLTEIAGGDAQALAQLVADLRRNNDNDSRGLRAAIAAGDWAEANKLAHRIRGACAMLGALRLGDASAAVQAAAEDHDMKRLRRCMATFEKEMLRLNKYLESLA